LSNTANITINGLKVGEVDGIKFLGNSGKILVTLRLKKDFEFSKNSIAEIYSDSFIGGKSLRIIPQQGSEVAQSGDTLRSNVHESIMESVTNRLEPLEEKVQNALSNIDTLAQNFNEILGDSGKKDLKETLHNL